MPLRSADAIARSASPSSPVSRGRAGGVGAAAVNRTQSASSPADVVGLCGGSSSRGRSTSSSQTRRAPPTGLWQCFERNGWRDYEYEACEKLEYAFWTKKDIWRFWDDSYFREVDIPNMMQAPGMKPVRRLVPRDTSLQTHAPPEEKTKTQAVAVDQFPTRLQRDAAVQRCNAELLKTRRDYRTPSTAAAADGGAFTTPSPLLELARQPQRDARQRSQSRSAEDRIVAWERTGAEQPGGAPRPMTSLAGCNLASVSRDTPHSLLLPIFHPALCSMAGPNFRIADDALTKEPSFIIAHVRQPPWKVGTSFLDGVLQLAEEYGDQLDMPQPVLAMKGKPSQMLVAVSLALHKRFGKGWPSSLTFYLPQDAMQTRRSALALKQAWVDLIGRSFAESSRANLEQLLPQSGGYEWVRKNDSSECCLKRLSCSCASLRYALELRGPASSERMAARGTKLLSWVRRGKQGARSTGSYRIATSSFGALDVAQERMALRQRVAVVTEADLYKVGGCILEGGLHGPQEELCTRSTLVLSLQEAEIQARQQGLSDASGHPIVLPEDGVVLSLDVDVFRKGIDEGYAPLATPMRLPAVLSVPMPNLAFDDDGQADTSLPLVAQRRALREKFLMAIRGASQAGAEVLIMSDVGCGALGNDPVFVGNAFGEAVLHAQGEIREFVITGSHYFQSAVRHSVRGKS